MFNDWVGEEGSRAQANKMHVLSWTEKEPISATFLVKFISIQVDVPTSIVWFLLLLFCFYMLTSISTFCGSNQSLSLKEMTNWFWVLVQSIGQRALHEFCPFIHPQQPYEVGSTVTHILQMREVRTQWLSPWPRRGPTLGHPGTGIHSSRAFILPSGPRQLISLVQTGIIQS